MGYRLPSNHRCQTFALQVPRHGPNLTSGPVARVVELVQIPGLTFQILLDPPCKHLAHTAELNPKDLAACLGPKPATWA